MMEISCWKTYDSGSQQSDGSGSHQSDDSLISVTLDDLGQKPFLTFPPNAEDDGFLKSNILNIDDGNSRIDFRTSLPEQNDKKLLPPKTM